MNLEMFEANAPLTVPNFLQYISTNRYPANMFWHRSVQSPTPFLIETGGYTFNATRGGGDPIPTYPALQNEFSISIVSGKNGSTGVGLVDVYDLD